MSHRQNRFVAIIDWLDFAIISLQLLPVIIHEVNFFLFFCLVEKRRDLGVLRSSYIPSKYCLSPENEITNHKTIEYSTKVENICKKM